MAKQKLTLSAWIDSNGGSIETAKILKVNGSTVRHWRLGWGLPRPKLMRKIKALTKGKLTYDEMIDGFFENKTK